MSSFILTNFLSPMPFPTFHLPTEPAKHTAELRHQASPESGPTCLKIDMTAGHFSASDRYKYLKELSFDYAFLLDQLGLAGDK